LTRDRWTSIAGIVLDILKILVAIAALYAWMISIGFDPYVPDDDYAKQVYTSGAGDQYELVRLSSGPGILPRAYILTDSRTGKRFIVNPRGGVVEFSQSPPPAPVGKNFGISR